MFVMHFLMRNCNRENFILLVGPIKGPSDANRMKFPMDDHLGPEGFSFGKGFIKSVTRFAKWVSKVQKCDSVCSRPAQVPFNTVLKSLC